MTTDGEKYMYSVIQKNIIENIATSYTNIYREKSNKKVQLQSSVVSIKCGDWCSDCLKYFIDLDAFEKSPLTLNEKMKFLDTYRKGICSSACVCRMENVDLNNDVIFITENVLVDDMDINSIITKLEDYMKDNYGDGYTSPDKSKIVQIINDININIRQYISQSVAVFQSIELKGAGTIKNVKMDVIVRAVMSGIATSKSSLETVNSIAQSIFNKMQKEIQNNIMDQVKDRLNDNKELLYTMLAMFILMFLYAIYLFVRPYF